MRYKPQRNTFLSHSFAEQVSRGVLANGRDNALDGWYIVWYEVKSHDVTPPPPWLHLKSYGIGLNILVTTVRHGITPPLCPGVGSAHQSQKRCTWPTPGCRPRWWPSSLGRCPGQCWPKPYLSGLIPSRRCTRSVYCRIRNESASLFCLLSLASLSSLYLVLYSRTSATNVL